ncbi:MAG TPA: AAA family ATPase, partial [Blastocatellia bacterium]|nr:AAA family ATPase [Blastocatellia bacterium]
DRIISTRRRGEPPTPSWSMDAAGLNCVFAAMDRVYLPRPVSRYISRMVAATHPNAAEAPAPVRQYVVYGASPRAAIAIAEAARAYALLAGRPTVGFEDVKVVAPAVLNHRLVLSYKAKFDRADVFSVIDTLLSELDETGLKLPADVRIGAGKE